MEFLVRGADQYNEPGVCIAFEEETKKLTTNVRSMGFDLDELVKRKKLLIDHVYIERSEIEETGEYNIDGLFIRLGHAVAAIKAKRVVLDSVESLFGGLSEQQYCERSSAGCSAGWTITISPPSLPRNAETAAC